MQVGDNRAFWAEAFDPFQSLIEMRMRGMRITSQRIDNPQIHTVQGLPCGIIQVADIGRVGDVVKAKAARLHTGAVLNDMGNRCNRPARAVDG